MPDPTTTPWGSHPEWPGDVPAEGGAEIAGERGESTLASANGPSSVRAHGEETLQHFSAPQAFERFVRDRWQGLSGEARTIALDAFVWGGCAFGEGLVAILELEPATPLELDIAQDIRRMVELTRRG